MKNAIIITQSLKSKLQDATTAYQLNVHLLLQLSHQEELQHIKD